MYPKVGSVRLQVAFHNTELYHLAKCFFYLFIYLF
uniref:Uncharacterized protein n=1 Tax=Anguilla anguilla TaxID=7936 RepID=A0A0E9WDH0_ANGAN